MMVDGRHSPRTIPPSSRPPSQAQRHRGVVTDIPPDPREKLSPAPSQAEGASPIHRRSGGPGGGSSTCSSPVMRTSQPLRPPGKELSDLAASEAGDPNAGPRPPLPRGPRPPPQHATIQQHTADEPEPEPFRAPPPNPSPSADEHGHAHDVMTREFHCNYVDVEWELDKAKGLGLASVPATPEVGAFVEDVTQACDRAQELYGLQPSSVQNQRENVLMLLANLRCAYEHKNGSDKGADDATVAALHASTLASFKKWARIHRLPSGDTQLFFRNEDAAAAGPGRQLQLFEIVLWWCIWGEASNMRFMPEFLSWVFYRLIRRRDQARNLPDLGKYEAGDGGLMRRVFRPMYDFLAEEAFRKDQAGNPVEHSQKKIGDDINEYFWRRRVVDADPGGELSSKYDPTQHNRGMQNLIEDRLKPLKKTYVERRSILHSLANNHRVFTLYLVLFQLIVTIGHHVPFMQTALPLCPPQIPVDECRSATTQEQCDENEMGCTWNGGRGCLDSCKSWTSQSECEQDHSGCKWDPPPSGGVADTSGGNWSDESYTYLVDKGSEASCHFYTTKTEAKILAKIGSNTYFNCDRTSGVCRYHDTEGLPVSYPCLDLLSGSDREKYSEYNVGEWWEFGDAGWWDSMPLVGAILRAMSIHEDPQHSGLSANRAAQLRMFDELWAIDNYTRYKRPFLNQQRDRFTCGFDMSETEGLKKAANPSYCCTIDLSQPDGQYGHVSVWTEEIVTKRSCDWSVLKLFSQDYNLDRFHILWSVVTLMILRLLGETLAMISTCGSTQTKLRTTGAAIRCLWYLGVIIIMVVLANLDDFTTEEVITTTHNATRNSTSGAEDHSAHKTLSERLSISMPLSLHVFEAMAILVLIPEFLVGSNSLVGILSKCCLAPFPRHGKTRKWLHTFAKRCRSCHQPSCKSTIPASLCRPESIEISCVPQSGDDLSLV